MLYSEFRAVENRIKSAMSFLPKEAIDPVPLSQDGSTIRKKPKGVSVSSDKIGVNWTTLDVTVTNRA